MDSVFKISGRDGSILWQLGGVSTSFRMDGSNFSRQHNARFVDSDVLPVAYDRSLECISLMNNVIDHAAYHESSANVSSALVIGLDLDRKMAKVVRRVVRPDKGLSPFGGNVQIFNNKNIWVSWSGDGYATEHDQHNQLVMEARFRSDRFTTCRAYKSDFVGVPIQAPDLRCYAHESAHEDVVTVCYVSWNGATEVRYWRFYSGSSWYRPKAIGTAGKVGFETRVQLKGFVSTVSVQGLDWKQDVLDSSPETQVTKVHEWPHDDTTRFDEL